MANLLHRAATLSFAALLLGLTPTRTMAVPTAAPADFLELTAWMDVADGNVDGVIVEVEVNGTKDWGRPNADGRVDLLLPAEAVAQIHFHKPGCISKTLSVDTHNMQPSSFKGKKPSLSFSVKLDESTNKAGLVYDGVVGTISFDAATGSLAIEQNLHLVPVRQQQKVVF